MSPLLLALALSGPVDLRVAFHVHTQWSDGSHSLEELARSARQRGIDALVLADHFLTELRYGPPFFRESLAFRVRPPTLEPGDLGAYVAHAHDVERRTGVLIVPGVELTPFYHWGGSLPGGDLTLHSAHRHLVVLLPDGPPEPTWSESLVSMGAPASLRYDESSLFMLWPLLPAGWALWRARRPAVSVVRTRYYRVSQRRRFRTEWVVLAGCTLLLGRSWPFESPRHDPYAGDAGTSPYQDAIDRAGALKALTFWAHPESSASWRHSRYPVTYRSDAYPHFVLGTDEATGFASLYEGYRQVAAPGGYWDQAIQAFLRGERRSVPWAVGELDLHQEGEAGGKFLGEVETIVRVRSRTRGSLLEALARGAGYAVYQERDRRLLLDRFQAVCGDRVAGMGERVSFDARVPCYIEARLHREGKLSAPVEVVLVVDGDPKERASFGPEGGPLVLSWPAAGDAAVHYYRILAISGARTVLHGNPVFVSRLEEES